MEQGFQTPVFSRAILTAVFVGFMSTLLAMGYDLYFVETLKFPLSEYINVATLIFFVNLLFLAIGFIYYGFVRTSKQGEIFYIIVFIVLTVFGVWKAEGAHRTDDHLVNIQFRNLLSGIIIILGVLASLAIPFLFHNKKFEKLVV
jgi:asparagine N-glycosylation enzyme membrane subunit Stt3